MKTLEERAKELRELKEFDGRFHFEPCYTGIGSGIKITDTKTNRHRLVLAERPDDLIKAVEQECRTAQGQAWAPIG